jgi:hypothetical protein
MNIRRLFGERVYDQPMEEVEAAQPDTERNKNIVLGRVTSALPTTDYLKHTLRFLQKREMEFDRHPGDVGYLLRGGGPDMCPEIYSRLFEYKCSS